MSRRQVTNRRELLLPSLIPARHQTAVVFDAIVPPAPATAVHGNGADHRDCNHQRIHDRAAKKASQMVEVVSPELIAGNHLLARLVFQRIRPRSRSAVMGRRNCSAEESQRARTPIASADIASPVIGCAEIPVPAPIPPAVETLFIQLARRRLGGRATEETRP